VGINDRTIRQLEAERDILNDLRPAFEAVLEAFDRIVERNFETESAAGEAFAPLAPSTIEDRARQGFGPSPILQRTKTMRGGATASRDFGSDFAEVSPSPDLPAAYHMSLAPRSKIPFRDFYAVSSQDEDDLEAALLKKIEESGE
jgi:hypothetical protein